MGTLIVSKMKFEIDQCLKNLKSLGFDKIIRGNRIFQVF